MSSVTSGQLGEHVEQQLDPLVGLQPPDVEQARLGRALARPVRARARPRSRRCVMFSAGIPSMLDQLVARRAGDRQKRHPAVEQPQRQLLEGGGQQPAQPAAELADVEVAVGMVDERHPRLAQPQRRQEHDPVDHLEDDVGVAARARACTAQRGAREHRAAPAHPVDDEVRRRPARPAGSPGTRRRRASPGGPTAPSGRCSRRRWRRCRRPGDGSSRGRRGRGSSAAGRGARAPSVSQSAGAIVRCRRSQRSSARRLECRSSMRAKRVPDRGQAAVYPTAGVQSASTSAAAARTAAADRSWRRGAPVGFWSRRARRWRRRSSTPCWRW